MIFRFFGIGVLFLALSNLSVVMADEEEIRITKLVSTAYTKIDRRPQKDLVHKLCFTLFETANERQYAGAVPAVGERMCPSPESIVAKEVPDTDHNGIAVSEGIVVSKPFSELPKSIEATINKKTYEMSTQANLLVHRKTEGGGLEKIDSFCLVLANNVDNFDDSLMLGCDKCSSLEECVTTSFHMEKPLPPVDESKLTRHSQQPRTTERPTHR